MSSGGLLDILAVPSAGIRHSLHPREMRLGSTLHLYSRSRHVLTEPPFSDAHRIPRCLGLTLGILTARSRLTRGVRNASRCARTLDELRAECLIPLLSLLHSQPISIAETHRTPGGLKTFL